LQKFPHLCGDFRRQDDSMFCHLPAAAVPAPSQSSQLPVPRIVVAEDHPVSLLVLEDQLAGIGGCVAQPCRSGEDAWAAVQQDPRPALLLTDLGLPGLDGLALARRIRAAEGGKRAGRLPIVAITATAGPEARLACLRAGIDTVLSKPVSFQTLRAVVSRYLSI
jgi:two-component system capsular synthesis sensor histidine kinase RcsC